MNALEKAQLEQKKAKQWFDGEITEKQAKSDGRLNGGMIDHWKSKLEIKNER